MDSPTSPLLRLSRDTTANKAEKNTTKFPKNSSGMASHLHNSSTERAHHQQLNLLSGNVKKCNTPFDLTNQDWCRSVLRNVKETECKPVGDYPGVDALEVLVHGCLVVFEESVLVPVSPDD